MIAIKPKPSLHQTINKILTTLLLLFSIYSFYLMQISPFEYLRFFAFAFGGIFCSGFFITRLLKCDNCAEMYSYSIGIGVTLNFAIYAVCGILRHLELYRVFALMLCTVSFVLFILDLKKNGFKKELFILPTTAVTAIIIMLFVMAFTFGFKNINPGIVGENELYPDVVWSLGNINSLTHSFPPKISQINLGVFKYHYFAMLLRAMLSLATAISTEKVFFALGQFIIIPFLIVSVYALIKKMLKSDRLAEISLAIFLLSGSASSIFYIFGKGSYFLNHFFMGFWAYPNGSDVAISFFCLWVITFIKIYNKEFITARLPSYFKFFLQLCAVAGFCFLATLSKGPFGALCVAAAVGVPFCLMLQKKPFILTSLYSLACVTGFWVVTRFFVSISHEPISLFISATVKDSLFWKNVVSPMVPVFSDPTKFEVLHLGGGHFLDVSAYFIPLHSILFFFPTCLFMIFFTVQLIRNFKSIPFESFLLLGTAYSGLIGGYIFNYGGESQTYFLLAAHLSVTILGLQWFFKNYSLFKKPLKLIFLSLFAISFLTGIAEYSSYIYDGLAGFSSAATHTDMVMPDHNKSITRKEYEAALWLKENTPADSIVATNRHFLTPPLPGVYPLHSDNPRYFYLSAYSNRQTFLEAWGYIEKDINTNYTLWQIYEANSLFYLDNDNDKPKLMKAVDVDYIYVSEYISPTLELPDAGLEKVFSNSAADIYAIKQ